MLTVGRTNMDNLMNLVVFDVDGTLVASVGVDETCFVQSFADVFDIREVETNWLEYQHQTDSGLTFEILDKHRHREPTAKDVGLLKDRFFAILSDAIKVAGITSIPGASQALASLSSDPHWCIAIATGGWSKAARLKLSSAGLHVESLPFASADDSFDRSVIVRKAVQLAKQRCGTEEFANITYVGDGVWDARSAKELGIAFIGVGNQDRQAELLAEGASRVVPDLRDIVSVLQSFQGVERTAQQGVGRSVLASLG